MTASEIVTLYSYIPTHTYAWAAVQRAVFATDGSFEAVRAVLIAEYAAPLVQTLCEACEGTGGVELDLDRIARCEACSGHGTLEVCPCCGVAPDVQTDRCGCPVCEICEQPGVIRDGVCLECFKTGLEAVEAEGDPEYTRWRAEQLELGRDYGWLG